MESENILNLYTTLADKIQYARNNKKAKKDGFNLFSGLIGKNTHLEKYHSNFLAYLLGPENDHDCDHIFLKTFLEMIREKIKAKHVDHHAIVFITNWIKDELENSSIIKEKPIESGRVDIEISGNYRKIFIENKIRSTEGKGQLLSYFDHYNTPENSNFMGIYLTKYGEPAASIKNHEKANEVIISLSYYDILEWLSSCVEKEFMGFDNVSVSIKQYTTELKKELGMNNDQFTEDLKKELSENHSALSKIVSCQKSINDVITQVIIDKRSFFLSSLLDLIKTKLTDNSDWTIKKCDFKTLDREGTIDLASETKDLQFSLYIKDSFPEFEDGGRGLWWGIYNIHNNTPFQGLTFKNKHWEGIQLNAKTNDFENEIAGSLLIIQSESSEEKKQDLLNYTSNYIIKRLATINDNN